MKRLLLTLTAAAALAALARPAIAEQRVLLGGDRANRVALRHARGMSWHANYYHTAWGTPVALVVPPTSNMQVKWGWGVAQSSMAPIYHQFYRADPGDLQGGGGLLQPTPQWPSHTDQFGVYYVRGPW